MTFIFRVQGSKRNDYRTVQKLDINVRVKRQPVGEKALRKQHKAFNLSCS
jgi:hypothetical protein